MTEIPGQMTIEDIPIDVDYRDFQNRDYWQGRADMKADVLRNLNFLSPICREPMVFSDHPNCNCWLGIQHCIVLVEGL